MINKIREEIKLLLDDDKPLSDDDSLITSGRLSSLKVVELASWLEKNYGVDFSAHSFNVYDFETVHGVVEMVENSQKSGG